MLEPPEAKDEQEAATAAGARMIQKRGSVMPGTSAWTQLKSGDALKAAVAKTIATDVKTIQGQHKLKPSGTYAGLATIDPTPFSLALHPWNHAPAALAAHRYDALKLRHVRAMKMAHATLTDALTGRRLDVIKQCVPVVIAPSPAAGQRESDFAPIGSVRRWH